NSFLSPAIATRLPTAESMEENAREGQTEQKRTQRARERSISSACRAGSQSLGEQLLFLAAGKSLQLVLTAERVAKGRKLLGVNERNRQAAAGIFCAFAGIMHLCSRLRVA